VNHHTKVLILDDDPDLRDTLGEVITGIFQHPFVAAASYDDLVALGRRALDCELAILDVNLGPDRPSGVDAFEWLRAQGFQGRIAFLTGHARSHPAVQRASRLQTASVHQKPMSLEQLGSLLEEEQR
jgi:DNA-binding NtrC family response regulator